MNKMIEKKRNIISNEKICIIYYNLKIIFFFLAFMYFLFY